MCEGDHGALIENSPDVVAKGCVLGSFVSNVSLAQAASLVCDRAQSEDRHGYVCAAPVHSIMEAFDKPEVKTALNAAWMVVPDGAPVAWMMRKVGFPNQQRVPGPDLMLEVCKVAAQRGIPIGIYGSTDDCLTLLKEKLPQIAPGLQIAFAKSPPMMQPYTDEARQDLGAMGESGAPIIFIGLGCPKQELWMHAVSHDVNAVLLGVGAAFDFHAGLVKRAPEWMHTRGLEWLYRLLAEPRRLFVRYARHNPRFVWFSLLQILRPSSPPPGNH